MSTTLLHRGLNSITGIAGVFTGTAGVSPALAGTAGVPPALTGTAGVPPALTGTAGVSPALTGTASVSPALAGTAGVPPAVAGTAGVSPARFAKGATVGSTHSRAARTFLLAIIISFSCVPFGFAQDVVTSLTNADILTMVKAKLPATLIIEKINNSACAFDTFPSVLAELKYRGVPDEVLMAMVKAPRGAPRPKAPTNAPTATGNGSESTPVLTEITIPDGTPLEVEATYTVSSAEVEEGSAVSFTVVHPVKINGVTVIARGARATARVTKAKKGGSWGRAGQLAWMMQDVLAVDGSRVPLEFSKSTKGDSKGGTVATGVIVTGVLFWPAAPFWGFKKGKDAKVPAGRRFDVSVHGNTTVKVIAQP